MVDVVVEGDRGGVGGVADAKGEKAAKRKQLVGAALLIVGGIVMIVFVAGAKLMGGKPVVEAKAPPPARPVSTFVPAPVGAATPVAYEAPMAKKAVAAGPASGPGPEEMMESARRAPLTAYSREAPRVAGYSSDGSDESGRRGESEDRGAFEKRFTAPTFAGASAGLLGDRRYIVAQGASIPCVLETAMQSDQPGFVSCVITRDVLSDDGAVVLMEKGTQVVGQYRGGLGQGQVRLHVIWSRAKTPEGVVVELASAATDALGRAGVGGMIDTHWMERFGSALLLSVVSDASSIGASQLAASQGITLQQTGRAPSQAAAIAVEQGGQMKPTLHKNQGELVSIFVARDLDFSTVYRLELVGGEQRRRSTGRVLK